jgi:hypothetical protein
MEAVIHMRSQSVWFDFFMLLFLFCRVVVRCNIYIFTMLNFILVMIAAKDV